MDKKYILDLCCGPRMMWVNKHNPNAVYVDCRDLDVGYDEYVPSRCVKPDVVVDFRSASSHPFLVGRKFKLIVLDPPHLFDKEETYLQSRMKRAYGYLNKDTWRVDIKAGFDEAWKLLDDCGVLIFKWNESSVKKSEVLSVLEREPLFGQIGPTVKTHWLTFMKMPGILELTKTEK